MFKKGSAFVIMVVMMISVYRATTACQVDEFYLTKGGTLAGSTPEILIAAVKFEDEGNREKLDDFLRNGTVMRLSDNVKVRVLERSFEFKTLKIEIPDKSAPYWVRDGSLKQINCK